MTFTLFGESDVSIKAGQAVTFVNDNPIEHVIVQGPWKADAGTGLRTAETDDGTFSLTVKDKNDVASHVFPKAGVFQFFCTIHKGMNGTVRVS
jgi:plastocyanin